MQAANSTFNQRLYHALYALIGSVLGLATVALIHANLFNMETPWLIAAFGATAVLLYGYPHALAAQPRYLFGGSTIAAIVGVSLAMLMNDYPTWLVAVLAVSLTIFIMALTDTMHPPGGAIAFIAVAAPNMQPLGFSYVLYPILSGISMMFVVAYYMRYLQRYFEKN